MIASLLGVVLGNLLSWAPVAASNVPKFAPDGTLGADLVVPRKVVDTVIRVSIHRATTAKVLTFHFELAVAAFCVTLGTVA